MDRFVIPQIKRDVYRGFLLLGKSIQNFERFLNEGDRWERKRVYYLARGCYKAGERCYKGALKNARKLAGPVEKYTIFPERLGRWRKKLLEGSGLLAKSTNFGSLKKELAEDKFLRKWMDREEIESSFRQLFKEQTKRERELANIKLRVALDQLEKLLLRAQSLGEDAQRHYVRILSVR